MPLPALPPLRRPPARALAGFGAVLVVLLGGWLWLRDSSLVAVREVSVSGASGPDAPRVRAALVAAARDMTTLHVRAGQLQTAVEPFPAVRAIDVDRDFPHGLRIVIHERNAVGVVVSGGRRSPIGADGSVLEGRLSGGLPQISTRRALVGGRVSDRATMRLVELLAAAPPELRERVRRVWHGRRGLTATVRDGPALYFGTSTRLRAKWIAAVRVLADRSSAGATYLDLRLPERPTAGGLEPLPTTDETSAQGTGAAVESTQQAPATSTQQAPAATTGQTAPATTQPTTPAPTPVVGAAGGTGGAVP